MKAISHSTETARDASPPVPGAERAGKVDLLSLRGALKPGVRGVTVEEMNETIVACAGVSERTCESAAVPRRVLGRFRGKLHVPNDFDEPLPDEIQRGFEGEDESSTTGAHEERARRR